MNKAVLSVALGSFEPKHLDLLSRWLAEPHIARWFPGAERDLAWAAHPTPGAAQALIVVDGKPAGYLRWQRVDRETLDELGLPEVPDNSVDADILLSMEAGTGKGIGPRALAALIAEVRKDPSVPMIGLTSELANHRAHRAFEKAGFVNSRQYETPRNGLCYLFLFDLRQPAETEAT